MTMTRKYLAICSLGLFSLALLVPSQYGYADSPSVTVSGSFSGCCWGTLNIGGIVYNAEPNTQVQLQVYAPNGNLVLDDKVPLGSSQGPFTAGFGDSMLISRDQGKGNYTIVATYHDHFTGKAQVSSWINNDPVVNLSANEAFSTNVIIQGRVFNDIAGEQVLISIQDPDGSTTANYTQATNIQGLFSLSISPADAKQAFPINGTYTITATHIPTEITGKTTLNFTTNPSPLPGPPRFLSANTVSSSEIDLKWSPPSYQGGTAVRGYTIERSTDGGNTWSHVTTRPGPASPYADIGLSPNTTYTYRVEAVNSYGTGVPSDIASATTLQ